MLVSSPEVTEGKSRFLLSDPQLRYPRPRPPGASHVGDPSLERAQGTCLLSRCQWSRPRPGRGGGAPGAGTGHSWEASLGVKGMTAGPLPGGGGGTLGAVTLRSRPPRGSAPPDHGPTRGSQYPGAHMVTLRAGIHSGPSLLGLVLGGMGEWSKWPASSLPTRGPAPVPFLPCPPIVLRFTETVEWETYGKADSKAQPVLWALRWGPGTDRLAWVGLRASSPGGFQAEPTGCSEWGSSPGSPSGPLSPSASKDSLTSLHPKTKGHPACCQATAASDAETRQPCPPP